jgi:hypothetical protein
MLWFNVFLCLQISYKLAGGSSSLIQLKLKFLGGYLLMVNYCDKGRGTSCLAALLVAILR